MKRNLYFSGGNNIGATLAADDSTHLLLLNSDIRVNSPDWLSALLHHHRAKIMEWFGQHQVQHIANVPPEDVPAVVEK